jgi:ABC-2 type transport system permease protein
MTDLQTRVIAPSASVRGRIADIWRYRELLVGMVRKDLKVRYKGSVLGFVWSLLNPAFTLVIYYLAFQVLLGAGIPRFPIFLLSGLLVWNLFSGSVLGAAGSILGAGHLVNKVYFPREILPLSVIGACLVHFGLQSLVLFSAIAVSGHSVSWSYLPLIPLAIAALLAFTAAMSVMFSALAVYARDLSHLLDLAFMGWVWLTPMVYSYNVVAQKLDEWAWLSRLNPITNITLIFQRVFYGLGEGSTGCGPNASGRSGAECTHIVPDESILWYASGALILLAVSALFFVLAMRIFGRLQGDFAEEI